MKNTTCLLLCAMSLCASAADIPRLSNGGEGSRWVLQTRDFETRRADGRFDRSLGFAMDRLRRMKPRYSFDDVKSADEMPAWRAKVRAKLRELLQIGDMLTCDFVKISEARRDGYRLFRYEFYPEESLAIPILVLVPEDVLASKRKAPAVICMPGSGAGLNSLAGEPDNSLNRFPMRNRQAWYYVRAGMIAVAIENPATAENSEPGLWHYVAQNHFARYMTLMGWSTWGFMTEHVLQVVEFLKRNPHVDASRIAVSGMSLGCIPALYSAVLSDDIAAVVYNDYVCSWAIRAMAQTEGRGPYGVGGGDVDPRRPVGFYRWFDDEPDLMAAIAPRPMILAEGGPWKRHIEKVKRAYALSGAADNLRVSYYEKFADPASRRFEDLDLKETQGLTCNEFFERANVDPPQHSFHPDVNVPWLTKVLLGTSDLSPSLRAAIDAAAREKARW